MSRWLVGMSGDKDAMIRHLEKCEKRMLEQFAEIKEIAGSVIPVHANSNQFLAESIESIIELCDVYVDKRSDKQKMQDQIDELKEEIKRLSRALATTRKESKEGGIGK